jgi:hypothetical protein
MSIAPASVVHVELPKLRKVAASTLTGSWRACSSVIPPTRSRAPNSGNTASESLVVVIGGLWHEVDVAGWTSGAMSSGAEPSDQHVLDAVSIERGEYPARIEAVAGAVSRHAGARPPRGTR